MDENSQSGVTSAGGGRIGRGRGRRHAFLAAGNGRRTAAGSAAFQTAGHLARYQTVGSI